MDYNYTVNSPGSVYQGYGNRACCNAVIWPIACRAKNQPTTLPAAYAVVIAAWRFRLRQLFSQMGAAAEATRKSGWRPGRQSRAGHYPHAQLSAGGCDL